MRGVARTIVQLLVLSSGLQLWLLGIGLALTFLGLGGEFGFWLTAAQGLPAVAAIVGLVTAVAAPVALDAMMFRAISAPHMVALIAYGRLKMVLGALASQLALSLFIGFVVGTLLSSGSGPYLSGSGGTPLALMASVSIIAFAGLTLYFLGVYWASQFKLGVLVFLAFAICPRLIIVAAPPGLLNGLFTTRPGLAVLLAASISAWSVFAVAHVRAGPVRVMYWGSGGKAVRATHAADPIRSGAQHYSRKQAVRLLLVGSAWKLNLASVAIYAGGTLLIGLVVPAKNARISHGDWLPWAALLSTFAALAPGICAGWMTLRGRWLWLRAGLARDEMFREIENRSWRLLGMTLAITLCIEVPLFILRARSDAALARFAAPLTIPLITGAAFVYVNMLGMPARRLNYILITIASSGVLLIELCLLALSPSSLLPMLLAAQAISVPVLRTIAQRRWQNMDWLINNPARPLFRVI